MSYPSYVSRVYLKEKFDKLKYTLEENCEISNEDISDKIDDETVDNVRYAVKNYCNSILNEFGWR